VPIAFQGSKCVRGELKRRMYQVQARYQVRANALLLTNLRLILTLDFPPPENLLLSGGWDNTVQLWDSPDPY